MWFYSIAAGIVIAAVAAVLAGRAHGAGHPALGGFAESVPLPVLGASVLVALGLAHHDAAWTVAWILLSYAAGLVVTSVAAPLARRAGRAGHPGAGSFTESASLPVSVAFFLVALGLALGRVDWTTLVGFPLAYAAWAIWHTLRRRRSNAQAR